jgi:hypothetical protein
MKVIEESTKDVGEIVYVSDYYDGPLAGLTMYKGQLCKFRCVKDDDKYLYYEIMSMNAWEKIRALWRKKKFELCVGYHWTYKNGKRDSWFYYRKPQWFYKWLFRMYYRKTFRKTK